MRFDVVRPIVSGRRGAPGSRASCPRMRGRDALAPGMPRVRRVPGSWWVPVPPAHVPHARLPAPTRHRPRPLTTPAPDSAAGSASATSYTLHTMRRSSRTHRCSFTFSNGRAGASGSPSSRCCATEISAQRDLSARDSLVDQTPGRLEPSPRALELLWSRNA